MRAPAIAFALIGVSTPIVAMPVSDFLSKFESLDPNGDSDRLASQLGELRAEVQKDAAELRAERLAATAAGKTAAYCPPADAAQPTAEEIVAALEEIPREQRPFVQVKDALRGYLGVRFPC